MSQIVTIKEYIQRVKVADKRRPTYYREGDRIPAKYRTCNFRRQKNGQKALYDELNQMFIIKNAKVAGKPRYINIRGNILYAGMHERIRMKMIAAIKDNFRPHVRKLNRIPLWQFPIQIDAMLYAKPEETNWDLDNLWIYIKCFQDLLIEYQIIPDDSVKYITKAPGFELFPVQKLEQRKMVFQINQDMRNITTHVMFRTEPVPQMRIKKQYASPSPAIYLVVGDMKAGTSNIEPDGFHYRCSIGIGKKLLRYEEFTSALKSVKYWAIQYNASVVIDNEMGREFSNYDENQFNAIVYRELTLKGIQVIIHNL